MLRQHRGNGLRRRRGLAEPAPHRYIHVVNTTVAIAELLGAVAALLTALRVWFG